MLKFYYFYTPDYLFWHNHLSHVLTTFEICPIKIENLQLQDSKQTGTHHFLNCTKKIELIIDCIEKNKNNYILFTDCTIFVDSDNVQHLSNYMYQCIDTKKDMFFSYFKQDNRNIGVILLNCNDNVLLFYKQLLQTMNEKIKNGINVWDQGEINFALDNNSVLNCGLFDDRIWVGGKIPKEQNFYIYKSCCDPRGDRQKTRLTYLYESGLINKQDYDYWINFKV
jgi:hypothetical protein